MAVRVDLVKCTGCGTCAEVCLVGAITVDVHAEINAQECVECGMCIDECPEEALAIPGGEHTRPCGQHLGRGRDLGRGGAGRGKWGVRPGAGPGGHCRCPSCGAIRPHITGVPCHRITCVNCGSQMLRG